MKIRNISIAALFGSVMMFVLVITAASAITDGELDGEDHPWVVLLVMDVGGQPACPRLC